MSKKITCARDESLKKKHNVVELTTLTVDLNHFLPIIKDVEFFYRFTDRFTRIVEDGFKL